MRAYTVHVRRQGLDPDRDLVLVKEGFSWPALLFTVLWALWHRLWLVAVGMVVLSLGLEAGLAMLGADPAVQSAVSVGLTVFFALLANDLRRWTLGRRSFVEAGVVVGPDADSAERRFLDLNPTLARAMAG